MAVEITEDFKDLSLKETALKVLAPDFPQSLPNDFVQRLKIVRDIPTEKYALQFVALQLTQFTFPYNMLISFFNQILQTGR